MTTSISRTLRLASLALLTTGLAAGAAQPGPAAALAAASALAASAASTASTGAASTTADLESAIAAAIPIAVEDRRHLHQNPELGYQERETAAMVAARLAELGFDEVRTGIAHTGVVGVLRGGRPGGVVAIRADMDALPVVEATDLPFRSTKRGVWAGREVGIAHACGHDLHTAISLGAAAALAAVRAELAGTVLFVFQPAEEGPPPGEVTGALAMVQAGALADPRPDLVMALHCFVDWGDGRPAGVGAVALTPGPAMAAVDQFSLALTGRQTHGAAPHLGIDPVVMAAQAVLALQTIRSRILPPREPSVLSIGAIHGGDRFNIIPAEVRMEGTLRTFDMAVRERVIAEMHRILGGIAEAAGGSYQLDVQLNAPVLINDPAWTARLRPTLERVLGADQVVDAPPVMIGEDVPYLFAGSAGFHFRLGVVGAAETGGLHTPTFRPDEGAIGVGVRAVANLVVDALAGLAPAAEVAEVPAP